MSRSLSLWICLGWSLGAAGAAWAGGAWLPPPGSGDLQLGFSRKTAHTSWDARGEGFVNLSRGNGEVHHHDFRYGYLSGELGLWPRLSARFLVTYLDGLEGTHGEMEHNEGLSDAWFGLKLGLREGEMPMALALTVRTSLFYDQPGPYDRHRFDDEGNFVGVSPEWRGLLKEDYTLSYLLSRPVSRGGWLNLEVGYSYREGAPADEVPAVLELGYPLPFLGSAVKVTLNHVQSVGNDSPRRPEDRFGSRPGFNFNNATVTRGGVAFVLPAAAGWTLEAGYNQWLMGRSARQYEEPYLSVGYRF